MIAHLIAFLRPGAIIGPLPSTLVNGTVADATQVMADLNWIVNQTNSNATGGIGTSARNLIYNGAMQLAQRIGSGGNIVVAGGTKAYTLDRWQVSAGAASSATVTQLTSTGLAGFQNALRLQRTAANTATTAIEVAQSMETVDSIPLQGLAVNVSFVSRAGANYSPTGNALTASLITGTGTDENVLTGYTGSATAITQNFAITNNWLPYSMSGTVSSTMTEFGLVFTMNPTGIAGANDYVDLDAIQVELGPSASTFDVRPFSETVLRCQRYYQKSFPLGTAPATNSFGAEVGVFANKSAPNLNQFSISILTSPRIATGIVIYNPVANNNQVRNNSVGLDFTGSTGTLQNSYIAVTATPPSGTTPGDTCYLHWSADAEL